MSQPVGRVAWEDESLPFPANLAYTWWECLVSPDRLFARVDWDGPVSRPILYLLLVAILAGTLGLFWFVWGPWGLSEEMGLTLELQLLSFFLTPFAVLAGLGVITVMQHGFVLMLAPARRGFAATVTVLCYASGVGLVSAVLPPVFGMGGGGNGLLRELYVVLYFGLTLAVQVWYVAVLIVGMRRAHATSTGRAAAIVLLPILIGVAIGALLLALAVTLAAIAGLPV